MILRSIRGIWKPGLGKDIDDGIQMSLIFEVFTGKNQVAYAELPPESKGVIT